MGAAVSLLLANYIGAAVLAVRMAGAFNVPLMAGAHLVLGASLLYQTLKLQSAKFSQSAIKAFYQFIWALFYSEYCIFPFI